MVGIGTYDKVSSDVVINAIEEATDSNYRKGEKGPHLQMTLVSRQ